jgi:hypothetical protein
VGFWATAFAINSSNKPSRRSGFIDFLFGNIKDLPEESIVSSGIQILSRPNCYVSLSQIARDIPETVLYQNLHLYKNASLTADSWLIANCGPFSLHLLLPTHGFRCILLQAFWPRNPVLQHLALALPPMLSERSHRAL